MFGAARSGYSLLTKSLAEVRGGVLILNWETPLQGKPPGSLRRGRVAYTGPSSCPYSPKCLKGDFLQVHIGDRA
jgi:hypothetical protein